MKLLAVSFHIVAAVRDNTHLFWNVVTERGRQCGEYSNGVFTALKFR